MSMTVLGGRTADSSEEEDGASFTGKMTLSFMCAFPGGRTPLRLLNRVPKKHRLRLMDVSVCHFELSASFEGAPGNEETERAIVAGVGGLEFKEEVIVYTVEQTGPRRCPSTPALRYLAYGAVVLMFGVSGTPLAGAGLLYRMGDSEAYSIAIATRCELTQTFDEKT
jgi:hypothetical protein